jgi:carbon-monoxide dehydrogenase large subunit
MAESGTGGNAQGIGKAITRYEDDTLLRGTGRYCADAHPGDSAVLFFVRAPVASGRIVSIDVAQALSCPGVLGVFTGADLAQDGVAPFTARLRHPGPDGGEMREPRFMPLAMDSVNYVGDPVAVVVAQSMAEAEAAADLVALDIDEGVPVVDALAALAPDAPLVWPELGDNRCFHLAKGNREQVEQAFAGASHILRERLKISRVTAAPLETRGVQARYDAATDRYHLETGTQTPHRIAMDLAPVLGVAAASIHVTTQNCGGSFGMKNAAYPEQAVALWVARRIDRPVRWQASRLEAFQSDAHGRDQYVEAALALDDAGHFLALDVKITANLGAYLGPATTHPSTANVGGLAGVYRTPAICVTVDGVFTNTQFTAPYRGAGRPEATLVIERLIDMAAGDLGLDRADLRRRNLIAPEQMPFRTGLDFTYDCGNFAEILDLALAKADWAGFADRRARSKVLGKLRGIGIANPIEIAGGPGAKPHPEFARLVLSPSGEATLEVGSCDSGQGHGTAFRQILAEKLGLDPDRVTVVAGDTGRIAKGVGTFGSRTMTAAGTSVTHSADSIVEALRPDAAKELRVEAGDLTFADGQFRARATGGHVALREVLSRRNDVLDVSFFGSANGATFPNGCHICEVEIDPETGKVDLLSYLVVDDVGTVINPMLVEGQIAGGVAQGVGQALSENILHDPESGQLLSATFMDYAMPRACDLPNFAVASHPVPTAMNPLGVKGVGEAGTVGALAATLSAVCDALAPLGVRNLDAPATPHRVWRAIQAANT